MKVFFVMKMLVMLEVIFALYKVEIIKQYSDLLCNSKGNKNSKYLDENPKNAVKWMNKRFKDIEKEDDDLINPKLYTNNNLISTK